MASQYFDPEQIGRRRVPDNKPYRANLNTEASGILTTLLDLIASNYPKDPSSNLAVNYRVLSREFARQQDSMNLINNDKIFTQTRIRYLQQVLGERLFLNTQIVPFSSNDVDYRRFLIAIKDAYLKGSKKIVIESLIDQFTDLVVNIRELYFEARKPNSAYGVTDTHKMLIEVFIDDLLSSSKSIAEINNDLNYFVSLVKPAHVLYDTKLIWTEQINTNKLRDLVFGDTGGGCVPKYIYSPFSEKVVLATKIQVVDPSTTGSDIFKIGSIQPDDLIVYLTNGAKVIVEPGSDGTLFFYSSGRRILFTDLQIGQTIRLVYLIIPGDFNFYYLPPDLVTNYDSRFYKDVFRKGAFQEFVKKEMDSKGRYPLQVSSSATTICDRWVQDVLQPMYEDMRRDCNSRAETIATYEIPLQARMWSPRFPMENMDTTNERPLIGDLYSFIMPYAPLTDGSGVLAMPADITVYKDGTSIASAVQSVDASAAYVSLFNTNNYWDSTGQDSPVIGDEFQFKYHYLADGSNFISTSFIFGINYWQLPGAPISNGLGTDLLALPSDVILSVDGTVIPDAVTDLEAINGFVTVEAQKDFWLASPLGRAPIPGYSIDGTNYSGDTLSFSYYKSGNTRYAMLFDDPSREFDEEVVFDGEGSDPARTPIVAESPLQIGYKFRADLLHHASVLNSFDTLLLNNYQKPAKRASIANKQDTLNHYNYFFSPEHLTDPDTNIILNDKYFDSTVSPVIYLNEGTPTFQQTYGYQPGMIQEKKLTDIRSNHSLLMYCDLLLKEYRTGNNEVKLSSICDNESPRFSVRFKENLEPLSECDEWILFDTAETTSETITIPGSSFPVLNLRIPSKRLRDNFILRETASIGITTIETVFQEGDIFQTVYQLPDTTRVSYNGQTVDFPALPVMHDATTLATENDIVVSIDGIPTAGLIDTFNPTTGMVTLYPSLDSLVVEYIQITQSDLDRECVVLNKFPLDPENILVNVEHGPAQVYGLDFSASENILFLDGPLLNVLTVGDVLIITYDSQVLSRRQVKFTYSIKSTGLVTVIDLDNSRVFDDDAVFPYFCYDGYQTTVGFNYNEYINFLSDNGKGIKVTYFNKDTYQLEEHIFSGPIFETYSASEDEISSMDSFPNALVRVTNPLSQSDPLKILPNYDFLNDEAVRIRKKTIKELLPDRSFRTIQILEALPV